MAITRKFWTNLDCKIWISPLRDWTSRSGAATDEDNDEFTVQSMSVTDSGFKRDIKFRSPIGGGFIPEIGNYQPATVSIKFVASDIEFAKLEKAYTTYQSGHNVRLTDTATPCKIRLQWGTRPTDGLGTLRETFRKIYYNAYITSVFSTGGDEGLLEGSIDFVIAPFNEAGLSNYRERELTGDNYAHRNRAEYNDGSLNDWDVQMGYGD